MGISRKILNIIVCSGIAVVALGVAGTTMIVSKAKYDAYEKEYNKNAEAIKASFPALPEDVFIDNKYVSYSNGEVDSSKSSYKKSHIFSARDASVAPLSTSQAQQYTKLDDDENALSECITGLDRRGGAITFTINTENYGMSDIEIAMRTNRVDDKGVYHEIENLSDVIKIQVNKLELKTTEIGLSDDREEFTSIILKNTFLIKGENTVAFTTSAYNDFANKDTVLYIMPDIRNLTVITDVSIVVPEE